MSIAGLTNHGQSAVSQLWFMICHAFSLFMVCSWFKESNGGNMDNYNWWHWRPVKATYAYKLYHSWFGAV